MKHTSSHGWARKQLSWKPTNRFARHCAPVWQESKDWDTTENLYIEGDNLEVLKLLQESYLGKVKMTYIDPPYNTGNDFIYADDFMRSQEEENEQMGMYDEDENRLFKNTDTNGRFHSDWCSMIYVVDFDTNELVNKSIASINRNLHVPKIFFKVETGAMDEIKSKGSLLDGSAFSKSKSSAYDSDKKIRVSSSVKYDLVGKLVGETGLTRKAIVAILTGIEKVVFEQFKFNPEEFIIRTAALINDEKATAIIQHITYNVLDEHYDTDIFTEPTIKGKFGINAMKAQRHLYDHIVYDSTNERDFAADLDTNTAVAVYVKLPDRFYISTPVGHYNPDWAIAFYEGTVKHIYFVAETKGSMSSMQLRPIEEFKIHCAREHFKAISNGNVIYDVVKSYQSLLEKVMK